MTIFAYELQVIKDAQAEKIKVQWQDFEIKFYMMREKLELYKEKASSLINEMNVLKKKRLRSDQNFLIVKKKPMVKKI